MARWILLPFLSVIWLTLVKPLTAAQEYEFGKDQDLVILLDRSQSIGSHEFNAALEFLRTLIEVSMVVHPRYTRLAVLTFDINVTIEFDHISSEADRQGGCALFGSNGSWSDIRWQEGKSGRDLSSVLRKAQSIFQVGKLSRPSVKQVLFLVGDGEWFNSDGALQNAKLSATLLRDSEVEIYAVGIGYRLTRDPLRALVSQPSTFYYQDIDKWSSLILDKTVLPKKAPVGDWFAIEKTSCKGCGQGADCYCQEYSAISPLCLCAPGFFPTSGTCKACEVGSYKDRLGNDSCTLCQTVLKLTNPGLKRSQCGEGIKSQASPLRYILIGVCILVITIIAVLCLCLFLKCRKKTHTKSVACGEDQKNIYTQTTNLNSESSATNTFDLINDVAMAHARLSDNSTASYTAHRNSFESHHIYDYVDETARTAAALPIPEIVFTMTDSDSTSDKEKKKRTTKNQFKNSKNKFSLRKRSHKKSKLTKVKKLSTSSTSEVDYDTVLERFKRQMIDKKDRGSIESLKRVGKVSAMVNMFERHATYMSAANALVRWKSEPRLPSASGSKNKHRPLKRQNSYVAPVKGHCPSDWSSTTYASSSDEKQKTCQLKHVPMRIQNELLAQNSSETTDSDSIKQCTYLEVIRTPRPSSLETLASQPGTTQRYENDLYVPPLVVNNRFKL